MIEAKKKRIAKGKDDAGDYYKKRYLTEFSDLIKIGQVEHPPILYMSTAKKRSCHPLQALELLFQGTSILALDGTTE